MTAPGSSDLSIDVAVATVGRRISNVASLLLSPRVGIRYVVSWQEHQDLPLPNSLLRDDVEVLRFDSSGLSSNRNNAIAHCRADIIVIADDDIVYYQDSFEKIRDFYSAHPSVSMALFRVDFPKAKCYPASPVVLNLPFPKGYYVSSVEMTFRREKMTGMEFYPEMGLGNEWFSASEDEYFVVSALKRGHEVMLVPDAICSHPMYSTGISALSPGMLRSSGALIRIEYPYGWPLRLLIKAWRSRSSLGFVSSLWHLVSGAITAGRLSEPS